MLATFVGVRNRCLQMVFWAALWVQPALAQDQATARRKAQVLLYRDQLVHQWDTVDCVKDAIKFDPLLLFRGEVALFYERSLSPRLGAQLGLGVTWRDHFRQSFFPDDADDLGSGATVRVQPSFHLAARYYFPGGLEPEGWYASAEFAQLRYVKGIAEKDTLGHPTQATNEDVRRYLDVRFLGGQQRLSNSGNWLFDWFGGVGLRNRDNHIVIETIDPVSGARAYAIKQQDDLVPTLHVGLRVGLGF
jgi:hypothetical protein